ncbi:MAG: Fic family protein [Truepera sp.]|nr:Fic family protein [Truepera sp.]
MSVPNLVLPRMSADILPEVVFTPPNDNAAAQRISRMRQQGLLRQLYRGVYSSNLNAEDADVVRRNWSRILDYLAPGSVLSHRSAFDTKPKDGVLYISRAEGRRDLELPGLTFKGLVKQSRGPLLNVERPGAADVPYQGFYVASQPRAYLENLTTDKRITPRQLSRTEIEERLEKLITLRGARAANALRDDAREVAERLNLQAEFRTLDSLIGAMLGTHPARVLGSRLALARAHGLPYDPQRVELFESVAAQIRNQDFAEVSEPARHGTAREVFAFVESYFSNYIEGTTFTVEEAQDIVFHGRIIPNRSEDSHDIKGTFDAALRDPMYSQPPTTADEFLAWLQRANAMVMQARREKHPGEWKTDANQAGSTLFVPPELVPETLRKAWSMMSLLTHPMQRALFSMFVVSETHPFTDGNGRTSRLLMNAFLSQHQQCRIIIPTVFREDYLLSLKALSHQSDATAYMRAMRIGQAWASELAYDVDVPEMSRQLDNCNSKMEDTRVFRLLSPKTGLPMRADRGPA